MVDDNAKSVLTLSKTGYLMQKFGIVREPTLNDVSHQSFVFYSDPRSHWYYYGFPKTESVCCPVLTTGLGSFMSSSPISIYISVHIDDIVE